MLPTLSEQSTLTSEYQSYLEALCQTSFQGEIETGLSQRLVMATDNSIYQILPQAVIYPKNATDLQLILSTAQAPQFLDSIRFSARGGGTGTNGQSLTPGIIIDCTRYMHQIVAFDADADADADAGWVRVQPGVVLDELNAFLQPHGVFFAPSLSPSNRATLGGMFSTDACGMGSCKHGRTSQHVISVDCILSDGTGWHSESMDMSRLAECQQIPGLVGDIHQVVATEVETHRQEIERQFPKLPRHMTGYNLAKVQDKKQFTLNYLLSGSEGTLALISELTLRVTPIPKFTGLFAVKYADFDQALRAARELLTVKPTAIETIDDNIWLVARQDTIYRAVQPLLDPDQNDTSTKAISFVQLTAESRAALTRQANQVKKRLLTAGQQGEVTGFCYSEDAGEMQALWDLRKKSVGLLANIPGDQRPMPFVEDTAVAPEHLADYIAEFRHLLASHGLRYGMFGHVDAGCLHVRPALNMQDAHHRALITEITARVNGLVQKYGGVLWSEHGRGFRTVFTKDYFGAILFESLRRIKTAFDPYDKLNPGKIATSLQDHVQPVPLESPMRGEQDQHIRADWQQSFANVMRCNGNAQCFDYHPDHVMCPSAKVTRDRLHSPKGRATVMREWVKQLSMQGYVMPDATSLSSASLLRGVKPNKQDFSYQVYEAMAGCLGCKACASACPVKLDVPSIKAQFLAHYHSRYRRPMRDYLVAALEATLPWQSRLRWLVNLLPNHLFGLVDLPRLGRRRYVPKFSWSTMRRALQAGERVVAIVPDAFAQFYEPALLQSAYRLLSRLGYRVFVLPYRPNGKGLFAKGFLRRFKVLAEQNDAYYKKVAAMQVPMVGIEPSTTLCFADEYRQVLGKAQQFAVMPIAAWLAGEIHQGHCQLTPHQKDTVYQLFSHCSEQALAPDQAKFWQQIFQAFGLSLQLEQTGCCGMAGSYGHEVEHVAQSKALFAQSWRPKITPRAVATGFSCRSQVKRCAGIKIQHPLEVLAELLQAPV